MIVCGYEGKISEFSKILSYLAFVLSPPLHPPVVYAFYSRIKLFTAFIIVKP